MAAPSAPSVDKVCPSFVRCSERTAKAFFVLWAEDQMNVVGHQTIGPYLDLCFACLFGEHVAIDILVAIFKEDRFAAVAPRGDMVRAAWSDDAWQSGHVRLMTASVGAILPQLSQGRRRMSQFFAVQALRDSRRELRRAADKVSCTGNVGAGTEFFLEACTILTHGIR